MGRLQSFALIIRQIEEGIDRRQQHRTKRRDPPYAGGLIALRIDAITAGLISRKVIEALGKVHQHDLAHNAGMANRSQHMPGLIGLLAVHRRALLERNTASIAACAPVAAACLRTSSRSLLV